VSRCLRCGGCMSLLSPPNSRYCTAFSPASDALVTILCR
jgi:hypothetical protein